MKTYMCNEIFASVQGEGIRAGTMNIFVRFTGCNMACDIAPGPLSPGGFACDTEFASGRKMTGVEILEYAQGLAPKVKAVIFTGGEPGLQVDYALVKMFKMAGYFTAIETNGTIDVADLDLDWITCSPKVAEHAMKLTGCNEIKYVRAHGQAIPRPAVLAEHKLISPAFESHVVDYKTVVWCLELLKENPDWRMSVQMHNIWAVR
jgi:7-carboxy-7-deazaguanine synthase